MEGWECRDGKGTTLINRFKLYVIKIFTIRRISRKLIPRRIYLVFTFSERHVTAFGPISKAAHSWSYGDN